MSNMFAKAASAFGSDSSNKNDAKQEHKEEGESLTTVLRTDEDRAALTILVANCTEVMRQGIVDTFDARQTGDKEDMVADVQTHESLEGDANVGRDDQQDAAEKERQEKARQAELAQREKELSAAKLQDLKKAAMDYFDEWRGYVLSRIGEVVNSQEAAQSRVEQTDPQQESAEQRAPPMKFPDLPEYHPAVQATMLKLYPPVENPLQRFSRDKRALILHSILLLLLSLKNYQSYSRTLLIHLTTSLDIDISLIAHDESKTARGLLMAAENMKADDETQKAAEEGRTARRWKVGLASVAGAVLIGVTGGLAAPLLAAGIGTVMGGLGLGATAAAGYLGALAGSSVLVGGLFGAYGGRMTSQMMDRYSKEVTDFGFVPVRQPHTPRKIEYEYRRLRVAIGISGWLTKEEEVVEPWKVIGQEQESFALRYELDALMSIGTAMTSMVKTAAWGVATSEIAKRTIFASLYAGLWPLGLLKVSRVLDNPFSIAHQRSIKAGEVLADALINKAQGERPVTLIGYSLGAKVIFTCVQRLAERRAFGLIESVILIGAPAPSAAADWRVMRAMVSGRVVNCYSTNDYILGFMYRGTSIQYGVAGLQAVQNVKGVENVDCTEMVTGGHTSYRFLTGPILKKIGFEDVDHEELAEEVKQLKEEEAEQREQHEQNEQGNQSVEQDSKSE